MIAARRVATLSLIVTALASAMPDPVWASPARRLARQGVVVVPVPTAAPAPAVVMPLPGALPVVTSRPLRPWRKSLVQPIAVLVPVPGGPLVAGPTLAEPTGPAPLVVPAEEPAAPTTVAPQPAAPTPPQSPTPAAAVEQLPAPPATPAGEPELRFGSP